MSKRPRLSLADYAVVALCPALIVLLLASLVYFVILCVYHGQYTARLGYIWFMFILGAVGIARVSIEQSRTYATGYAAVLGLATFVVLSRFQVFSGPAAAFSPLVNLGLIATVWLLADRITYDCTQINDDQDAGGQGLLDGFSSPPAAVVPEQAPSDRSSRRRRARQPGRTVFWLTAAALPLFGIGQLLLRSDPHLLRAATIALALYLFATLSLLVATSFLGVRRYLRRRGVAMPADVSAAWLGGGMAVTALILLLCFALPQPGRMLAEFQLPAGLQSIEGLSPSRWGWGEEAATEDASGEPASGAPANESGDSAGNSPADADARSATAAEQSPSNAAADRPAGTADRSDDAAATPPSKSASEPSASGSESTADPAAPDSSSSDSSSTDSSSTDSSSTDSSSTESSSTESSSTDPSSTESSSTESSSSESSSNESSSNESSSNESSSTETPASESDERSGGEPTSAAPPPTSPPPSPSPPLSLSLTALLKASVYLVLLAILAAFLWTQRAALAALWQRLHGWFAGRGVVDPAAGLAAEPPAPAKPPRPFASFANPLHSGVSPSRAVVETFQAAEAWYREQGQPRRIDETPHEYSLRLKIAGEAQRRALARLAAAYNRTVYGGGGGGVTPEDLQAVQEIWQSWHAHGSKRGN